MLAPEIQEEVLMRANDLRLCHLLSDVKRNE